MQNFSHYQQEEIVQSGSQFDTGDTYIRPASRYESPKQINQY